MTDLSLSQTLVFGHLWQSVAIAAVLATALLLGKRMRGSTRYGLGVAALAASLVLPLAAFIPGETIISSLLQQMNAPVRIEHAATTTIATVPVASLAPAAPAAAAGPAGFAQIGFPMAIPAGAAAPSALSPITISAANAAPSSLFTLPTINMPDVGLPLLAIWLLGAAIMLLRTGRDLIAVERLVARARPAELPQALQARMKGVRVVVSPEAPGPMAAGLLRPCIVLPESIALASPGMAALLEHEHAHIRRNDMAAALAQRIVLALLWWSPALYWINRRIDEEREVACDEAAVERTGDARAFARSLTTQAENQLWVRAPRLAVGAIGPRSQFGRRIRRLIDIAKTGGAPAKYSGRIAFAGLALAIGVAAMVTPRFTAMAQTPDDNDAKPAVRTGSVRLSDQLDGAPPGHEDGDFAFYSDDIQGLTAEIDALMAELTPEITALTAEIGAQFGPEMQVELAGLSTDLAGMRIDISQMVTQEVLSQMPDIMEEVQRSLEQAGLQDFQSKDWNKMSAERAAEVREALEEARDELRRTMGPEMQAEIRAAMAEARAELASHRDEIAAAMQDRHAGIAAAHEAIAAARAELDVARARGDFRFSGHDGAKFDFGPEIAEAMRKAGAEMKNMKFSFGPDSPGNRLIDAADDCDMGALNALINDEKANVNTTIPGTGTALMAAAESGCLDAARTLINAGAALNHGFPGAGTPLTIATQEGRLDLVNLLLSKGADVEATVPGRDTPLMEAIDSGDLSIVKALVEKGANVNRRTPMSGMRSPLQAAQEEGQDEIASYLSSKGAAAPKTPH